MITGIVCPETEPPRKDRQKKIRHKEKRNYTSKNSFYFILLMLKKKIIRKLIECSTVVRFSLVTTPVFLSKYPSGIICVSMIIMRKKPFAYCSPSNAV